jgi:hypothetical protein
MKRRAAFLLFFCLASIACGSERRGSPFDAGMSALGSGEFRDARELLEQAVISEPDAARRDEAQLALARIEWRVFRELDSARARLRKLTSCDAYVVTARMAVERNDFAAARDAARQAIAAATNRREQRGSVVTLATVVARDPGSTNEELRGIVASLRTLIAEQGAYLAPARVLARAALRAGDGAAALEAIDAYYHVSPFSAPPQTIAAAYATAAKRLPAWRGERDAELASALAGVRMFEEAALVDPDGEIARYAASLRRITDATNEHYRQIALGDDDRRAVRKILARELKAPRAQLAKQFGTYINDGKTAGHHDLHMGHIVVDRSMNVEQYGRKGTVRFVALDGIVSNGYSQWMTDGGSGDGGWGTAKEIYQVRPMYADSALADWERVNDPVRRAEDERKTADETRRDEERARQNPIQQFPGLVRRLRRQYLTRVAAETKTREAFLARVESELFQSSIVLHEGRHAIDAASGESYDAPELEYRGKLSEVALGASPRAVLQNVLDHPFDSSPHGEATERLARELVQWMEKHRNEIAGLEPSRPLLPQLDKLTDDQLRAAARSLDPFAAPQ